MLPESVIIGFGLGHQILGTFKRDSPNCQSEPFGTQMNENDSTYQLIVY